MKHGSKRFLQILLAIMTIIVTIYSITTYNKSLQLEETTKKEVLSKNYIDSAKINMDSLKPVLKEVKRVEVYKGMTLKELSKKLNKSLNSTLRGKGKIIAKYALKYKVDPYLATAIILHETGCKWNCSYLAKVCYNFGGIKGNGSCGNTGYQRFSSVEDGIRSFMKNLYQNYYARGLDTVEELKPTYAGNSKNWDINVRRYIDYIKSR